MNLQRETEPPSEFSMAYVALDVAYGEPPGRAKAAAVVFRNWSDAAGCSEHTVELAIPEPYTPGEFYRRELPCLLAVLERIEDAVAAAVIDGYVHLGSKPGLGQHFYEATQHRFPVVGVAKRAFRGAPAIEVLRGRSRKPLYASAAGIESELAARCIRQMHGQHRIPTLLRRVDQLAKG